MSNIFQILESVNGASIASIDTETVEVLRGGKSNPYQGRVTKVTSGSRIMLFQNKNVNAYDAMVKRRLVEEGKDPESFVLQNRKWGTRLQNLPVVEHDGSYYLEVIFLKKGESRYMLDGQEASPDVIPLFGLKGYQGEAEQGGLDNKVVIRTYKLDSILQLRINGKNYRNIRA